MKFAATSALGFPTSVGLNRNCLFKFETSMVSMSITCICRKPIRAKFLSSSQPRPPAPTTRTYTKKKKEIFLTTLILLVHFTSFCRMALSKRVYKWTVEHVFSCTSSEIGKLALQFSSKKSKVSFEAVKSGWAKGPPRSSTFLRWLQRPFQFPFDTLIFNPFSYKKRYFLKSKQ